MLHAVVFGVFLIVSAVAGRPAGASSEQSVEALNAPLCAGLLGVAVCQQMERERGTERGKETEPPQEPRPACVTTVVFAFI